MEKRRNAKSHIIPGDSPLYASTVVVVRTQVAHQSQLTRIRLFATDDPNQEGARAGSVETTVYAIIAGVTLHVSVRPSSKPLLFVLYIADYHMVSQSKGTVLRIFNKVYLSSWANAYGCTCVGVPAF